MLYVQISFTQSWYQSGVDSNGYPVNTQIDLAQMVTNYGYHIIGGSVSQLWGCVYSASGFSQPLMIQAFTDNLPLLKNDIASYLTSIGAPASMYATYDFSVDVNINP
jgi:hypothetical protein